MIGKRSLLEEVAGTAWLTVRGQIVLPPCDRVPVTCSYALSTDGSSYVGFIEGRFGLSSRFHGSLAIHMARDMVFHVRVTSFSENMVSFRVPREDWIVEEPVARSA